MFIFCIQTTMSSNASSPQRSLKKANFAKTRATSMATCTWCARMTKLRSSTCNVSQTQPNQGWSHAWHHIGMYMHAWQEHITYSQSGWFGCIPMWIDNLPNLFGVPYRRFLRRSKFAYTAWNGYEHPTLYYGTGMLSGLYKPRGVKKESLGLLMLNSMKESTTAGYHFISLSDIENGSVLMKRRAEFAKMCCR